MFHNFYSPLPLLPVVLIALAVAHRLARHDSGALSTQRYASIDGLRGFLALFVFIHHASIWWRYAHDGQWVAPTSRLYNHLGQDSVALFFMVTAFLFTGQVLDSAKSRFDWPRFAWTRLFRLMPVYLLSMALLFVLVAFTSQGMRQTSWLSLLRGTGAWLMLGVAGTPDLNDVAGTWILNAGVVWSLPYEVLFYAALPLLAWLLGRRPGGRVVLFSVVMLLVMRSGWHPHSIHVKTFLGGIAAAFLARSRWQPRLAASTTASAMVVLMLALAIRLDHTAFSTGPLIALGIAFCILACGNDLWGGLTHPASIALGKLTYSMYLLHGLVLYAALHFLVTPERMRGLEVWQYWGIILGLTPVVVGVSHLSTRLVEQPAQAFGRRWRQRESTAPSGHLA
ncbi:MAG: acyltransferase [Sphaerotilus natans]